MRPIDNIVSYENNKYLLLHAVYYSRLSISVRVRIGFSVWFLSGYAHVFILVSAAIVTPAHYV